MSDQITHLASEIRESTCTVGFTGAGVSTPSGIPDFRSEDGVWQEHDPTMFDIRTFEREPAEFWRAMLAVYDAFPDDPDANPAHVALADLESRGHLEAVVTQNADGLHQEAGSDEVIELHGNLAEVVCRSCNRREPFDDATTRAEHGDLPPECDECGGVFKPDGVLFGEQLPENALFRAHALAERADVFLVAGSSLSVEPAASLPSTAANHDATLAIVNLEPTPHDDFADYLFHDDVATVLPQLAEAV